MISQILRKARYYCRRNWHFVQTQSKRYWNSHSSNNTKPRSSMNFYIFCSWWQPFTDDTWGLHKDWESLYSNELQNFCTLSTLWTALIYMVTYFLLRYFTSWTSGRNSSQSSVMTDQISNLTKQSFPEICRTDHWMRLSGLWSVTNCVCLTWWRKWKEKAC